MIVQTIQDPLVVFFGEAFIKLQIRDFDSEFISLHTDLRNKLAQKIQVKRKCLKTKSTKEGII